MSRSNSSRGGRAERRIPYFRLILLPEPDTLRQAVRDIGDFLEHYHQ